MVTPLLSSRVRIQTYSPASILPTVSWSHQHSPWLQRGTGVPSARTHCCPHSQATAVTFSEPPPRVEESTSAGLALSLPTSPDTAQPRGLLRERAPEPTLPCRLEESFRGWSGINCLQPGVRGWKEELQFSSMWVGMMGALTFILKRWLRRPRVGTKVTLRTSQPALPRPMHSPSQEHVALQEEGPYT